MPEKQAQLEGTQRVADLFAYWQLRVENHNSLNFYNINIVSEDIAARLINLTYRLSLENLNKEDRNISAVDLGDDVNKIAYQVKSRCSAKDIYDALEKFQRDHCHRFPRGIRFFILLGNPPKPNRDKCRTLCPSFDPGAPGAVLTGKELLKAVTHLAVQAPPRFQEVLAYLEAQFAGSLEPKKKKTGLFTPLPPMTADLIGRKQELADLGRLLGESGCVLLVNGMGGVGKTEVCKSFFRRNYGAYRHGGWLDYVSSLRETLVRRLTPHLNIKETETLDEIFKKAVTLLEGLDAGGLWVVDNLDNAADPDLPLLRRLPFRVLVNSRLRLDGFRVLSLEFLSMDECRALFDRHYQSGTLSQPEAAARDEVIKLCHRHTLTVELLARTAFRAGRGISFLLAQLEARGFDLNPVIREEVGTWWHDETRKKQFFGHLETVFDLSGVEVEESAVLKGTALLPARYMEMAVVAELLGLEEMGLLNGLVDKGWLMREGVAIYMHPVVSEVVRRRDPPTAAACRALLNRLADKLFVEPGDNPLLKADWVVYGESVLGYLSDADESAARLANNLSMIYKALGELEKAREFQEKALNIREAILDPRHPDLATSYNNLSTIYQDLGELEKAREFQEKALNIREAILDPRHPDMAQSYNNLSLIYQALGELEKAREFQEKTVTIFEAILAPRHPDLATSYNNFSLIYQDLGELEKAREFQEKALNIREAILDPRHPDLATS
ncbi:MAG: ATP-binding protein, partial [bacterium]|nr:ATP-binding protein [bacterium]